MDRKFVAIIPARGGSKRIPGKNKAPINGAPMISYPIKAALGSDVFESVVVTTDDPGIAEIATGYGAEVPFKRSQNLSDDHTPTIPVIRDAITQMGKENSDFIFCCIYPTSIFLNPAVIKRAADKAKLLSSGQFLISVTSYPYPIQRALARNDSDLYHFIQPEYSQTRSQDLPETFHDAAQFYWGTASTWLAKDNVFENALGIHIENSDVQDIDTPEDLVRAEMILKLRELDAD